MRYNRTSNPITIQYEDKTNHPNTSQQITDIAIDIGKCRKQTKLVIHNIDIYFPYKPYDNQLIYMTKVIEALNTSGSIAGLESPTGTGKTLCLLCACLGWLRAKRASMIKNGTNETPPKLFYSSRTHSQLSGVIKELKKTCYLPSTAILSSRDNMCVNSLVKNFKGNSLKVKCKQMRYRKECKYFFGAERLPFSSYDNCDIEELNTVGSKSGFCPFFFERRKKDEADVIFLPYNYIFDSQIKSIIKINLAQSILVIDEAHNVESVCEDSVSCQLSFKTIDEILLDLKGVKHLLNNQLDSLNKESVFSQISLQEIEKEEEMLQAIKAYIKSLQIKTGKFWPNIGLVLSPKEFFDIFFEGSKPKTNHSKNNHGFDKDNLNSHIDLLRKIELGLSDELQKSSIILEYIHILSLIKVLVDNHLSCIESNDSNPLNNYCNNYRFFINDIDDSFTFPYINTKKINAQSKIRTLFLYCFNPGFGFKNILNEKLHSLIITSGTLTPIEGVESELKCSFDTKLENKHVIDKAQVSFSILTNAIRKKDMVFKFDASNKSNNAMIDELGHTIIELCRITPGGVLVFFASYSFMNYCFSQWNDKEVIIELSKVKEVYKDMHDNQKNKAVMKNYTEANQNTKGKGAILLSVFRGTTSEGIDFSDDYARMAILIGIPYPNLGDVRVQMKKVFLDDFNKTQFQFVKDKRIKRLTGNDWYTQTATRTVNQALGRVIRHINDYGSMVLIDVRFKEFIQKRLFSSWLKDIGRVYTDNKIYGDIRLFFEKMKKYIKKPIGFNNEDEHLIEIQKYEETNNTSNTNAKSKWIKKPINEGIENRSGFKVSDDIEYCIRDNNDYQIINNNSSNEGTINRQKINNNAIEQSSIELTSKDKKELINAFAFQPNTNDDETINHNNPDKAVTISRSNRQLRNNETKTHYSVNEDNNRVKIQNANKTLGNINKEKGKNEKEAKDDFKIKSEAMIKRLLELKDRSELNSLFEQYNMRLQYEDDANISSNIINHKESSLSSSSINNKPIDCPICSTSSQPTKEKYKMAENNWDKYSSDNDKKDNDKESSSSVYNEKELEYLDKYIPLVKNAMDENELYDLIMEYNFNDAMIEAEIKSRLKYIEAKGQEYGWNEVKKVKKPKKEKAPEVKKGYKSGNKNEEKDKEYVPYTKVNYYSNSTDNNDYYNQKGYYGNNYNSHQRYSYPKQYYQKGEYYNNKSYGYNYNDNYYYNSSQYDYGYGYDYNQGNSYSKRRKGRPQLTEVDSEYTKHHHGDNKPLIESREDKVEVKKEVEPKVDIKDSQKWDNKKGSSQLSQYKEKDEVAIIKKKIDIEPKPVNKPNEMKQKEIIEDKTLSVVKNQPVVSSLTTKKQTDKPTEVVKSKAPETSFVHLAISTTNQISVQPSRTTMGFTIESKKPSNPQETINQPQSQSHLQSVPQQRKDKQQPQLPEIEYPYQMPFYPPQYPMSPAYFKYQPQGTPSDRTNSNPYYQYPPYAMKYMMYPPYQMYDDQQAFYYPQPPKK